MRKLTTKEFIEKARAVHGDRYDYSKVMYIHSKTKVILVCSEHGEWKSSSNNHLMGKGCPICSIESRASKRRTSLEDFILAAKLKHGDKYCYSQVGYVNAHTKISIICPQHGEWYQTPYSHLMGNGCPKCGIETNTVKRTLSLSEFILKAKNVHGDKYDYTNVEYVNSHTNISIQCPHHGVWLQTPTCHLSGQGCPECGGNIKHTKASFILAAKLKHGDKYCYSQVGYVNAHTKISIICPQHGEWYQTPNKHLMGKGCPGCAVRGFSTAKYATLYCLRSEDGRYIKVGISNKHKQRIMQLKRATPFDFNVIELLHKDDGAVIRDLERQFHNAYESANLAGFDGCTEWLMYHPDIPELINLLR